MNLQKISALLLAFLVVISTTSFAFNFHYCGSKLVSYAANKTLVGCCKAPQSSSLCTKKASDTSFSCCKDKKIDKDSEDDILGTITTAKIQIQSILLLFPQLNTFNNFNLEVKKAKNSLFSIENFLYKEHSPNTNILYQVFLI